MIKHASYLTNIQERFLNLALTIFEIDPFSYSTLDSNDLKKIKFKIIIKKKNEKKKLILKILRNKKEEEKMKMTIGRKNEKSYLLAELKPRRDGDVDLLITYAP